MRRNFYLSLFVYAFGSYSNAVATQYEIDCDYVTNLVAHGQYRDRAQFRPSQPFFQSEMTFSLAGMKPQVMQTVHLSPNKVCGVKLDFAKNCEAKEYWHETWGYEYEFHCTGDKVIKGMLTCDKNCHTDKGGFIEFRCEGPLVNKNTYYPGPLFAGCKLRQAEH